MSQFTISWPFIKTPDEIESWISEDTWFKGIHTNVNFTLKTYHDLDNNKYYFHVYAISGKNDVLIKDTFIIDNPKLDTLEDEIDFYQYLKCLVSIIASDVRLICDNVFIVGPSGIINCKSNENQNEAEIYQIENKEEFYTTKYTKFLNMMNEKLFIRDIINKESNEEESFLDIPFIDSKNTFTPSPFGCVQMISIIRREKHGDLVYDVNGLKFNNNHIYIPDEKIVEEYGLNPIRMTFLYKALLDYYLKYGEESLNDFICDVNFKIQNEAYDKDSAFLIQETE